MITRNQRGFTLIELLVVIAIIGILSSVVLASLNSARTKARDARRVADIKQIQVALELYFDANSEYPDALAALASDYIAAVPTDPSSTAGSIVNYPYDNYTNSSRGACVTATGSCLFYHLGAKLEQGAGTGALLADRDLDAVVGTGPDGLSVTGNCALDGSATTGTDLCYDVTP